MRHVPEDELHAYLDQALSRSQAIEIETHLARCLACCRERDAIAALRDRTTALLARAAPRLAVPPRYSDLMVRVAERRKISWRRGGLLAASLAGALFAGWAMRSALDPQPQAPLAVEDTRPAPSTSLAAVDAPGGSAPAAMIPAPSDPVETIRVPDRPLPSDPLVRFAAAPSPAGGDPVPAQPEPGRATPARVHPTLGDDWVSADPGAGDDQLIPSIPGWGTEEVRLLDLGSRRRPAVFAALRAPESGNPVYLVEGPVTEVADLVAAQLDPSIGLSASEPARAPPDYLATGAGVRRQGRVLTVLGSLPVDSLNALARRVVIR